MPARMTNSVPLVQRKWNKIKEEQDGLTEERKETGILKETGIFHVARVYNFWMCQLINYIHCILPVQELVG